MQAFIETKDDILWLKETHLSGVTLPTAYKDFKTAILQGNEDCPYAINLYIDENPIITDNFYRIVFKYDMIYCESQIIDGITNLPIGETKFHLNKQD